MKSLSENPIRLAGVVITRNEQSNIARCLESLEFCDEIVVVDAESEDATREIALRFSPNVVVRPWPGYTAQRNAAVSLSSCDWILSVDADEVVPKALQREIRALLAASESGGPVAFSIPRKTIHFGRWIRHGGWYPNRLVRLFRKSCGSWVGSDLHERWAANGPVGELNESLLHFSFVDLSDQVARNNRYSSLGAQKLIREGASFTLAKLVVKTFSKFVETYFLKRGFLDGYPGLIISVSAAYSVFLKWAKIWEIETRGEGSGARS